MAKNKPILTVTLNPALDLTGHLPQLEIGGVNAVARGHLHPAGKGINAARVLKDLGAAVAVTGFLGRENQAPFRELFRDYGFNDLFVEVAGATRVNVKMVEENGRVTDLNFPGVEVRDIDRQAFARRLREILPQVDDVIVAGSLPRGVGPACLAEWMQMLATQGKRVIFDSSGEAFGAGLAARPYLIKPNEHELAGWAGKPLESEADLMAAAGDLQARHGIPHVVVSRGADGVIWLAGNQWWRAKPPRLEVVSTVGAGDSMVAGLTWGLSRNWPVEKILRMASAVSALAVTQVGVGIGDPQRLSMLLADIDVQEIC